MKIKNLLGMLALDANANEIGKIVDADFDPKTGKFTQVDVSLKKNIFSSSLIEVSYDDIKSIGDYVLLNIEIDKEQVIADEEAAKEAEKEAKKAEKEAKKAEKEAKKAAEANEEVVDAEIVDEVEEEVEEEKTSIAIDEE